MKHHKHSAGQNQQSPAAPKPASATLSPAESAFIPSPDEVARRAYFTYENQGAPEGRSVQHWLAAEAELTAERKLTRTHGYHTQP